MNGSDAYLWTAFIGLLGKREAQAAATAIFVNLTYANFSPEFV